ncbi:unnamed protein product [Moneuplotes crassus]|uniref:histone deacetylase n=1 Tax=Euplotes crassus TaxID=5936 RepID=A0AAD1UIT6_EUPCR|nr:unnamed protein product [Moneuplotes crassus]
MLQSNCCCRSCSSSYNFSSSENFISWGLKDGETSKMFSEESTENKHTPECARLAAGSSLQTMKDVVTSPFTSKAASSLMRPPCHHGTEGYSNGYCFFNNAAIAAHFVIKSYNLKRFLILDWDVSHCDETQEIFYESSKVFFISVHRWEMENISFIRTAQATPIWAVSKEKCSTSMYHEIPLRRKTISVK